MSTSCKPALDAQPPPEIRPFPYAEVPACHAPSGALLNASDGRVSDNRQTLAGQEAAALEKARQEGEAKARAAFDRQLAEIRDSVRSALTDFTQERANYYQRVEREVVQLAINIARKILRREAQIDPLLLAGMVRVSLEKIESGTKVVVRVHPDQVSECRAYFAQHMEPREVPEVVEDSHLPMQQCVLQTVLGTTELGPEVQLKEIEQGLFDLLGQRPQADA
jgi:flagellar assembly protein FliH